MKCHTIGMQFIDFKSMTADEIGDTLKNLRALCYNASQMVVSRSDSSRRAAGQVNRLLRVIEIGEAIQRQKRREETR